MEITAVFKVSCSQTGEVKLYQPVDHLEGLPSCAITNVDARFTPLVSHTRLHHFPIRLNFTIGTFLALRPPLPLLGHRQLFSSLLNLPFQRATP